MEENWRDIKDYIGLYQVSNCGRVKSLKYGKERILKPGKDSKGYLTVRLYKNGKGKSYSVHRLVWDAFGDSPRNGRILQVDHINNDKTDNRIENLQLLLARDNSSKRSLQKENKTSKYIGAIWHKLKNKWQATIYINKKQIFLGYFNTQEEAAEAYLKAKENLSPEN